MINRGFAALHTYAQHRQGPKVIWTVSIVNGSFTTAASPSNKSEKETIFRLAKMLQFFWAFCFALHRLPLVRPACNGLMMVSHQPRIYIKDLIDKPQRMRDLRVQCTKKRQDDARRRAYIEVWEVYNDTCHECKQLKFRYDMSDAEKTQRQAEIIAKNKELAELIWQDARDDLPRIAEIYQRLPYDEKELREHLTQTFF